MSDQEQDFELAEAELTALKAQADLLGIKYHTSIGAEKLSAKIKENSEANLSEGRVHSGLSSSNTKSKRQEASKLIRVMVTCMNPLKSEWEGEIFTVGNATAGTFKKYVPFGVEWHVPQIMYNMIDARQCQVFQTKTDKNTGQKSRQGRLIKEFAIQNLPPLSKKELDDLAQRQAMANGTSEAA